MVRLATPQQCAALGLLVLVAGCVWPHGHGERDSVAQVTHPQPTMTGNFDEPAPSPVVATTMSQVAYQAADESAPLPADLALGAGQSAPAHAESEQGAASAIALLQSEQQDDDLFNGQEELSVEQLVAAVQVRNPSLQAVSDAWRAATERYPQVIALDDPMFTWMISPSGFGTMDSGGWMVQASQKIPWTCKRALRGSVASAEANVMRGDIGDTRLILAEATRVAFFDYYMAARQMEVNAATQTLVSQLREIASDKYQVGQVTQQDVLQADVELADLATRRAELTRDQQLAQARINTLLHRVVDYPLPPPPQEVSLPDALPVADDLQQAAIRARPDLYAQASRIQAEEANLALVCREYYPDLNLVAKYDGFMPEDMRPQVGMDVNIPIRYSRRSAMVNEAAHRVAQRRAEYRALVDRVQYEVQASVTQVVQAAEVVRLYRDRTLPAAESNLASAQANYAAGSLDFLRLLDAERRLNAQREKYYAAVAEYHRRLAGLDRAVGTPVQ